MSDQRQQSISKLRNAYENNQLGFQKGAKGCFYYDKETDSCCAIGILMDESERVYAETGNVCKFADTDTSSVKHAMEFKNMMFYKGLSFNELGDLQNKHDRIVAVNHLSQDNPTVIGFKKEFKDYLYSLK